MKGSLFSVLAAIVTLSIAAPTTRNTHRLPRDYKQLLPPEVSEFIESFTDAEIKALNEIFKDVDRHKSEDEVLQAMREKSEELYKKVIKLHNHIKKMMERLDDEARKFAKEVAVEARRLQNNIEAANKPTSSQFQSLAVSVRRKYVMLSDAAKEDLEKHFPLLTAALTNQTLVKIAGDSAATA